MNLRLTFVLSTVLCILTASCHPNQPPSPPTQPPRPPSTRFLSDVRLMDLLVLDITKRPGIELAYDYASYPESGGGNSGDSRYRKALFTQGHLSSRDRIETLVNYLASKIDNQLQSSDVEGSILGGTMETEPGTYTLHREYAKAADELQTKGFIDVLVTHRGRDAKGELVSLAIIISESTIRKW
jgi:hypothetical protein